jgi:5-formyltetrahydrofolate cyclo-ligase
MVGVGDRKVELKFMIVVTSYGKRFEVAPVDGRTLLNLVNDSVKIPELDGIPFQCQSGTCKRCVVFVEAGHTFLTEPDLLEQRSLGPRLQRGFRLACQARARNQKTFLRKRILEQRLRLDASKREEFEQAITSRCLQLSVVQNAKVVMAYLDIKGEVSTRTLIESLWNMGKTVLVPVVDRKGGQIIPVPFTSYEELKTGAFGIPEPDMAKEWQGTVQDTAFSGMLEKWKRNIDVVIVPGVAFRSDGGRLGYGGGYYDRFLPLVSPPAVTIGLAFPLQIQESFPVEVHDVKMDYVVTPKNVFQTK